MGIHHQLVGWQRATNNVAGNKQLRLAHERQRSMLGTFRSKFYEKMMDR